MSVKAMALSIPQVAQALGISKPVAYELTKKEGFPVVRISESRLVVPVQLLEKWLEDRAREGR